MNRTTRPITPELAPTAAASDPAPKRHRTVRFELAPRTLLAVGLVVMVFYVGVRLMPVLLVLVAALILVGALNPVVAWLEQRKVRRAFAIGLVFGVAAIVTMLAFSLLVQPLLAQVQALIEHEPEMRRQVVNYLENSGLTRTLANHLRDLNYSELLKQSGVSVLTLSVLSLKLLTYGMAAIFLALYIMIDRDRLRGALFALVKRKHHLRFSRVLLNLETIVGGYIRGQVITSALIAAFMLVVLLLCRVPNALALAVLGGAMDVLPYIGALLTIAPAVMAAYAVSPAVALTVLVLMLGYEEFESRVLVPLVYGKALRLPSAVVFFSLLAGGALGGVLGALLALPIASALLMLLDELRVDLPGEPDQPEDLVVQQKDEREEREYAHRAHQAPAEEASAIAVEIARERKQEEKNEAKGEAKEKRSGKLNP